MWFGGLHEAVADRIAGVVAVARALIGGRELVYEAVRDTSAWRQIRTMAGDPTRPVVTVEEASHQAVEHAWHGCLAFLERCRSLAARSWLLQMGKVYDVTGMSCQS